MAATVVIVPGAQQFPEIQGKKITFVAAAGNGGNYGEKLYPAAESVESLSNIIGVGASTRYDKLASFSTMADGRSGSDRWVEAVAPGEDIISTIPGGRYGMWSGTSMSAPIVSGIAALSYS